MSLSDLIDMPTAFDPISRVLGVIFAFKNGDWKKNYKKYGWLGIVKTFWLCFTDQNTWEFVVSWNTWSGSEVEKELKKKGIKLNDIGFYGKDEFYFRTKRRQARWAEYVMKCLGVPVVSRPYDKNNNKVKAKGGRKW